MSKDAGTGEEIKNEHEICLSPPFSDGHITPSLR